MHDTKEKKIALVAFAIVFVAVIFASAVTATKDVRQNPVLMQQSLLRTSQNGFSTETEEIKEKKKENSINVGMTLIVTGSIVIIIAGSASIAQYRKQEAFK